MTHGFGVTSWFLQDRGPDALIWAAQAGFRWIHIDLTDVTTNGARELLRESERTGVTLAGLSVNYLEHVGLDSERSAVTVRLALNVARALGVPFVYLPSFGAAEVRTRVDMQATAELLCTAAVEAESSGITIATENSEWPITSRTVPSQLFELVGRDDVELLLDTQNLAQRGIDVLVVVRDHRDRIRTAVHVKDGITELGGARLGAGSAGVAHTVNAVLAGGYDGTFIIESDYRVAAADCAIADQAWLRAAIDRGRLQREREEPHGFQSST